VPSAAELPARLLGVLQVIYLIFNEGYSANAGDRLVRADLCAEALRLGRLLAELLPEDAEVLGLLALMELHDARRAARVDAAGRYVALPDQDRSLWDEQRIEAGRDALERAVRIASSPLSRRRSSSRSTRQPRSDSPSVRGPVCGRSSRSYTIPRWNVISRCPRRRRICCGGPATRPARRGPTAGPSM
jgi:hypothetical protein